MAEQYLIARRGRVVELVPDNVFEAIGRFVDSIAGVVALDGAEQMIALTWIIPIDKQISKVLVPHYATKPR